MNLLASLIGLLFLAEGLIGISLPGSLSSIGRGLVSPSVLYGSGAVYAVFGVVQLLAAPHSRLPRMIRASGFVLIASGVALPLIGVTRVIAFVDWWLSLDPTDIRLGALAVAVFGGLAVYGSCRLDEVEEVEDFTASGPHVTTPRSLVDFLTSEYPPMLKPRHLALGVLLTVVAPLYVCAAIPEPIRTANGLVTGAAGAGPDVRVFKGLPYAAPPVGDLRWQPPQPAKNWDGVRAAEAFSANCMQRQAGGGVFPPYGGDRSATQMSEDCLYLNVYTAAAAASERRPVMVWIHGGAYTSGAGAIYQGEDLARKGVVVVTINYRLGVFGFMAHPELTKESPKHVSGNYAFLDQIAALAWVQKNVASFGGDPSRVTIFGESAGSWSVNNLVATPLARGLFHRAIGESGGQFTITRTLAESEATGTRFGDEQHATTIAALRALPAATVNGGNFQTSATVDGWVFPQDVMATFKAGKQNDVPVIIGSNANEGSIFTREDVTAQSFRQQSERRYGADVEAYLKLYPFSNDTEARAAQAASMRDGTFGWEMRTWARLQTESGKSKVYMYYLSRVPPLPNAAWLGAQHGAEIPYAFNWPNGTHSTQVPWTETDKRLAGQVSSYWVNFAATGDPNGKGLAKWDAYQAKDDRAMLFADAPAMGPVPNKPALDFLDTFNAKNRDTTASRR